MKRINRRVRSVGLLLFAAVACAWAQKKITVPTDFPTIQKALDQAEEGDTVFVKSGVYKENINLADDVVLRGADKKNTIIDGRRRGPVVVGADGAVITGFTIRNGTTGILCKNTRPIIRDNIIMDNKGTGIHALVTLPDIVNNVVYRNLWTGIFLESVRGTRTSIDHNVIMENGYSGIFCANKTEVLVRNNIMYGNKQYGVFVGPEARKTRIVNNNIYKNRISFNENADNQTTRQQNMSVEPQFANLVLLDFKVKQSSPCKGKGDDETDIGLSEGAASTVVASGSGGEFDQYFSKGEQADSYAEEPVQEEYEPMTRSGSSAPAEIRETVVLHGLNFRTESAVILEESYEVLDEMLKSLKYYTDLKVEIAGHTDNQGKDDFNRKLSLDRARSVMNYFVDRGVDRNRIRARGYGADKPVESNTTADGRASNRRVEVVPLK